MNRVGLAMIVRNAAPHLRACLESARPWVQAMVVVDTGSTDGTPRLAARLGAQVLTMEWADDFAAARNHGLRALSTEWVLALDADERLEVPDPRAWRAQLRGGADAFQVTIRNYVRSLEQRVWDRPAEPNPGDWPEAAAFPGYVEHQNVRLFRRHPDLYFVGRVHESVGPRVLSAGLRLGEAVGRIHHFGLALPPEQQAAKNRYYRELGVRKVAEQPWDAQAHFELGLVELDNFNDAGAALRCFAEACRHRPGFALAWFFAGVALLRLDQADTALQFFQEARRRGYDDRLGWEMEGDALYRLERFAEAAACYATAAAGDAVLASKQGLAEVRGGATAVGLSRLRAARAASPPSLAAHDRLVAACVWLNDAEGALEALRYRLQAFPGHPGSYLRPAALLVRLGRRGEALACLRAGRQRLPDDPTLLRAWQETWTVGDDEADFEVPVKSGDGDADTACEWKKPEVAGVEWPSPFRTADAGNGSTQEKEMQPCRRLMS